MSRSRRTSLVVASLLASSALAGTPTVTGFRLVTGRPDTLFPAATIANLDAGDLVAGHTLWDHDGDGVFFAETRVGFLWSPADGIRPFEIRETVYFDDNRQGPSEISDGGVVVGTDLFTASFSAEPFAWSAAGGLQFLALPGQRYTGSAVAVSGDGRVVVGSVRPGFLATDPSQASQWTGNPRMKYRRGQLPAPDLWSNAWDTSADGDVVVGDGGPSDVQLSAVRWVRGELRALEAVGEASTARFASADGTAALGWAEASGRRVLVRWDSDGAALVADPPAGATIETIRAVNPSATAAAGALSVGGNWAPFVWTQDQGFVVLPELDLGDTYDRSDAYDVSDDGSVVVGALQAGVQGPGDPPPVGFVWLRGSGTFAVDDLLAGSGFDRLGVYEARSLSGDGSRLLATGDPPRTAFDTNSVIVDILLP